MITRFHTTPFESSSALGGVTYGPRYRDPHLDHGFPELTVHAVADSADAFTEVWHTDLPIERGALNGVVYAHDGENLFCATRIDDSKDCAESVRSAYLSALDLTQKLHYRRIFRMWNFITDINGMNSEGLEIYRDFCQGRAEAFREFSVANEQLPAATGVGVRGGGIGFCLLASRSAQCTNIENSRQVAAYHYPRQYGPSSPSFARATHVASAGGGTAIYVSGTASIVGHQTLHRGQIAEQCSETFANLEHLLTAGNLTAHGLRPERRLEDLRNIKVYVRNRQDIPTVRMICAKKFGPAADIAFLNLDLCRADLLVEIEGIL